MADAPFVIRPLDRHGLAMVIAPSAQGELDDASFNAWFKAQADAFSCGDANLDRYIRTQVTQDARRDVARAFVIVDMATKALAGYYTLSTASVRLTDLPPATFKRLPRYPDFPAVLIGRLAIDRRFQGRGLGGALIVDICRRTRRIGAEAAVLGIIVDAIDDAARSFYERHQFLQSPSNPYRLVLPIGTIRQLDID